jgi:hypothetical protein
MKIRYMEPGLYELLVPAGLVRLGFLEIAVQALGLTSGISSEEGPLLCE